MPLKPHELTEEQVKEDVDSVLRAGGLDHHCRGMVELQIQEAFERKQGALRRAIKAP